jgi:hypothetical protein
MSGCVNYTPVQPPQAVGQFDLESARITTVSGSTVQLSRVSITRDSVTGFTGRPNIARVAYPARELRSVEESRVDVVRTIATFGIVGLAGTLVFLYASLAGT